MKIGFVDYFGDCMNVVGIDYDFNCFGVGCGLLSCCVILFVCGEYGLLEGDVFCLS